MTKVFIRPRPLADSEAEDASVSYAYDESSGCVVVGDKRFKHLAGVLSPENGAAYAQGIRPLLAEVLEGKTACCFAYGHTNSGKTHTIFGYGTELGMYQRSIEELFEASNTGELLVQVRFFELYNGKVYDLLDERRPGFVREDADGTIHVRSETTMGPKGEVLTQSLRAVYHDSPEAIVELIRSTSRTRAVGTSELHTQSSRSHAVLELEIVTPELAKARQDIEIAKSRVVPIGKARDDLYIAIQSKLYAVGPDGKYMQVGKQSEEDTQSLKVLQDQFDAAEDVVKEAEQRAASAMAGRVGGALVFVDLAGAEYTGEGLKRSSQEMREAKEINASLLALKECIRAQSSPGHTPYRNSKLTMLLKGHLDPANASRTVMIANVSSSAAQATKAMNTIKYAVLVADAFKTAKQ